VVSVGAWKQAYLVRDVVGMNVIRLSERYADALQVAWLGSMRTDGRVLDNKSFATGIAAAS